MAAGSTAVTVLTPNGRRQTIKVSPNTPMLQVLEDVCKKHGFNADDYGLKFQRNVLDLTVQWRFASLPNNAKLEMVPSTRKQSAADSQVRIALQMEDGSRLQGSFCCDQNLWELLTNFPQIRESELLHSGYTPVCVYMRDEANGEEALKKTTLKSLGLTGGSAILRFLLKKNKTPEEEDGGQPMKAVAMPTTPIANERMPSPSPHSDLAPPEPEPLASERVTSNPTPTSPMEIPPPSTLASATLSGSNILPVQQQPVSNPQNAVRPKDRSVSQKPQEEDGEKAGPSGLNSTYPPSSLSPSSAPFIPFSGGGQRLGGPGAAEEGRSLPSTSSSFSAVVVAGGSPKAKKAKPSHDYNAKHQVIANQGDEDVEQLSRHQVISSQGDEDIEQKERLLEPVERESLIYSLDTGTRSQETHEDLPDEFFEVTVDDIRKRFAQLKSERRSFEEAPLMTKALREAQMKEKIDRYPKVVLRVQFPDRHILQGFFRPLETVATLTHFVKSHLEDPQLHFYLFIAPPKTILDNPSVTLFQANLFPGALVYFGSDYKSDCYLQRELLGSRVSALQANESIARCMPRSMAACFSSLDPKTTLPPPVPATGLREAAEDNKSFNTQAVAPKPLRPDPGKVPKWLKLPGKK